MSKALNIVIGLILLAISIYFVGLNIWDFRYAAITVFKGILVWGIFFIGIALVVLGINDLRN